MIGKTRASLLHTVHANCSFFQLEARITQRGIYRVAQKSKPPPI